MNKTEMVWEGERNFYKLRHRLMLREKVEAIGVALFDFIVGFVGTIACVAQMVETKSFFPFVAPAGYVDDMEGPISRRLLYLSFYCTLPSLLICSVLLLAGILMRRTCCISFWYIPNALGLILHTALVVIGAVLNVWRVYAISGSLLAFRILLLAKIYNFQKALAFDRDEDKLLDDLCLQSLEVEEACRRQFDDMRKVNGEIVKETKAVTRAVLNDIGQTVTNDGPGPQRPNVNSCPVQVAVHPNTSHNAAGNHLEHPPAYNSELFSAAKQRAVHLNNSVVP